MLVINQVLVMKLEVLVKCYQVPIKCLSSIKCNPSATVQGLCAFSRQQCTVGKYLPLDPEKRK
ncbi:hypothetical protein DUNSADRAFT_12561 [Dunaliella salina]|uniref:Uncharacterized protein n=1 Tax=Dunaliella salina TaxID=3046 RepID=A0ABQ7GB32_DUNSA|nr:hypothetical protein DUNSADRAFT_12561 [Dunaliella salina]|eukprot:KAF5831816.1 hypothetical protein DUNSADRAFT_12561 [Dunaliella salina]